MAGALYFWIMLGLFVACVLVIALVTGILWLGHWMEKKETGATHGFLEVPPNSRSRPVNRPPVDQAAPGGAGERAPEDHPPRSIT